MHSGLLSGADSDRLSVLDEADGIRLGILQSDQRDLDITDRLRRKLFILRDHILKERIVNDKILASLLEGHAIDLLALQLGGLIGRIHLKDDIVPVLLGAENLKSLLCISRRNNTVRHFALNDGGCILVTFI